MQEFRKTMSIPIKGSRTCYLCRQEVSASYRYLIRTTGIARNRSDHVPPIFLKSSTSEGGKLYSRYNYIGLYTSIDSKYPITACGACWIVLLRRENEEMNTVEYETQTQRIEKYHNLLRVRTWHLVAKRLNISTDIAKYIADFIN